MLWQLVWLLLSICSFAMSNLRSSWCHGSWYDCNYPFVPLQCQSVVIMISWKLSWLLFSIFLSSVNFPVTIMLWQVVRLLLSICSVTISNLRSSWCYNSWYDCYCPDFLLRYPIYGHHNVMTAGIWLLLSICSFTMSNLRSSWCHDSWYDCYVHLFLYNVKSVVIMMSWQLVWLLCPFVPLQCQIYGHHDVMTAGMTVMSICSFTVSNLWSSWCYDSWCDCYCLFVPLLCQIYDHHDFMTAGMTVTVYLFFYNVPSTVIMMSWQLVWMLLACCSVIISIHDCADSLYDYFCPFVPLQCQISGHYDAMIAGVTVTVHLFLYNVKSTVIMMSWQLDWLLLSICSFTMSNLRSS